MSEFLLLALAGIEVDIVVTMKCGCRAPNVRRRIVRSVHNFHHKLERLMVIFGRLTVSLLIQGLFLQPPSESEKLKAPKYFLASHYNNLRVTG